MQGDCYLNPNKELIDTYLAALYKAALSCLMFPSYKDSTHTKAAA